MRKRKKPTSGELAVTNMMLALQVEELEREVLDSSQLYTLNIHMLHTIFEKILDGAGTIGEARKWYKLALSNFDEKKVSESLCSDGLNAVIDLGPVEIDISILNEEIEQHRKGILK